MDDPLFDMKQVIEYTTLGRTEIYEQMSKGLFPKPFAILESRRRAWRKSQIQAWIDSVAPVATTPFTLPIVAPVRRGRPPKSAQPSH